MVAVKDNTPRFTPEEYFAWEEKQPVKHEYITQYITYPCLIVEVLSDSTEAYDRGSKFRMYRHNPALRDCLLVSSTAIEIDLYRKNDAGEWIITNYQSGDTIEIKSIALSFEVDRLYRGLVLTPEAQQE
jgi:Uma2 family endonuclease